MDEAYGDPSQGRAPDGTSFQGVVRPSRRSPTAIALAALAVLAFALLTKQPDPAGSVPTAGVSTQPERAATLVSSPAPVVAPRPSPTPAPPGRDPAVTPQPTSIITPAGPGTNQLGPAGQGSPRVHVVLGDGWMRASDGTFAKASGTSRSRVTIGAWSLGSVHVFPCRWSAGVFADPRLMQTAEGQAQALASWWGQDPGMPPDSNAGIAPVATKPRASTLVGFPAWSLEILIPTDFDMSDCDGRQLVLWGSADDRVRMAIGPGELIRVWVVDVEGEPVVIEGSTFLAGSPEYATELDQVLDSIVIERGSG